MNKLSWVGASTAAVAVSIAAVLAACSSSSTNNSGPPTTATFASQLASNFCSALQTCCQAAKYQYDDQSCEAQLTAGFQASVDVVKRGKVIFDPNAAVQCENAIAAREEQCGADASTDAGVTDGGSSIDPITAACWPVLKGIVPPGGACDTAGECATTDATETASCEIDTRATASSKTQTVCFITETQVAPGGTCRQSPDASSFETDYCDATRGYCDIPATTTQPQPTTGTCMAFVPLGGTCLTVTGTTETEQECAAGSYCDINTTKTCKALPTDGQPCIQFTNQCSTGTYCDQTTTPATPTCRAQKAAGATCVNFDECQSDNCDTTTSDDGGIVTTTGVCTAANGQTTNENTFDVSPRTCGFGPEGSGPDDAGIVAPATGSSSSSASMQQRRWFEVR